MCSFEDDIEDELETVDQLCTDLYRLSYFHQASLHGGSI